MEFRRLVQSDLDSYFANRLLALENSPSAFLTTLAEEKLRGRDFFTKTLAYTGDDKIIVGAIVQDKVVGTVGLRREERPKTQHKAMIWGMYVDVAQRKAGVGGKMLEMTIQHARDRMKVSAIYLSVESENLGAKRLYESRGFKTWGVEPLAMADSGRFFSEDHMVLML